MSQKKVQIATNSSNVVPGFSAAKLKQLIQNEVFDILSGIKQEIEIKMKEIDRNITILKNEIFDFKKSSKIKQTTYDSPQHQNIIKQLFSKVQKIQKEVIFIKNTSHFNESMNLEIDISKSNVSKKQNHSEQKTTPNEKSNSPLFKKSYNQTIDLGALVFEQQKQSRAKPQSFFANIGEGFELKNEKKTNIFTQNTTQNLKKPPLPTLENKSKGSSYSQYSTSASFYKNQTQNQNRNNQIMGSTQGNSKQKVQQELGKNKNVFLRKKKSQEKHEANIFKKIQQEAGYHKFSNQLEQFGEKQEQSFNIELEYSKDTFLSDF